MQWQGFFKLSISLAGNNIKGTLLHGRNMTIIRRGIVCDLLPFKFSWTGEGLPSTGKGAPLTGEGLGCPGKGPCQPSPVKENFACSR